MDEDAKDGIESVAKGAVSAVLSKFSLRGAFPTKPQPSILAIRRPDRDTLVLSIFNPGPKTVGYPGLILERKSKTETTRAKLDANVMPPFQVFPGQTLTLPLVAIAPDEPRVGVWRFLTVYDREWLWGLIKRKGFISSNWTAENPTGFRG